MVQRKILKGFVVEVKDGSEGMVCYNKDNDNIGINFGHWHQIKNNIPIKGLTEEEKRDMVFTLGSDDVFCKSDIVKVIRDNSIYKSY